MACLKSAGMLLSVALYIFTYTPAASADGESYQLVDKTGKELLKSDYNELRSCGSGVLIGLRRGETKLEILNQKGETLQNPTPEDFHLEEVICKWQRGNDILKGLPADALLHISQAGHHGIIDSQGKVVVPVEFDRIDRLGSEFYLLGKVERDSSTPKSYFFSSATRTLSKNSFTRMLMYQGGSEGLIQFCERVVPASKPRDPYHRDFNHRELTPQPYNQWGYCDVENKVIVPAQFESESEFHEGFAIVKPRLANISKTYIDRKGQIVSSDIVAMSDFRDGLAIAAKASAPKRKYGLINKNFEFILPPVWDELILVAKGIFAAKNTKDSHYVAITPAGKKLFDFSSDVASFRGISFGENEDDEGIVVNKRKTHDPTQATLSTALLSRTGKILIPSGNNLSQVWFGMAEVIVDSNVKGNTLWGVKNFSDEWLIKPQNSWFSIEGPDCLIKTIRREHFDSSTWANYHSSRLEEFQKFLKDYNLIGMSYDELTKLLGRPAEYKGVIEYNLIQGTWCAFDVQFKEGKVHQWRYNTVESSGPDRPSDISPWLTANMVFEPSDNLMHAKLIFKTPESRPDVPKS
jgi:hypothetical protein